MKTKFSSLFTSAGLVVLLSIALLGSSTAAFADPNGSSREPEGSWLYTVTIPDFGSFQGVETYSTGGAYSEADQLSFSPGTVASAGHGAWKSLGGGKFLLTYVNLTFDKFSTGAPTGTSKVRLTATIDRTGNSYSGSGDFNYFDPVGNPVFGGSFTITATRILVEPPGK
jgi:hypothetical protein